MLRARLYSRMMQCVFAFPQNEPEDQARPASGSGGTGWSREVFLVECSSWRNGETAGKSNH